MFVCVFVFVCNYACETLNHCCRILAVVDMATSPNTGQSSHKNRFWSKFRGVPKPIPRRKRVTSDSVLTTPSPSSHFSPLTLSGHTHKPHTTPTAKCDDDIPSYKFVTDEMTLPEFALQFQNELPQQVVVTHGVYWKENLEVNISSSERLNIHFIRHRESVSPSNYWLLRSSESVNQCRERVSPSVICCSCYL